VKQAVRKQFWIRSVSKMIFQIILAEKLLNNIINIKIVLRKWLDKQKHRNQIKDYWIKIQGIKKDASQKKMASNKSIIIMKGKICWIKLLIDFLVILHQDKIYWEIKILLKEIKKFKILLIILLYLNKISETAVQFAWNKNLAKKNMGKNKK
jgi:hypothetical protein